MSPISEALALQQQIKQLSSVTEAYLHAKRPKFHEMASFGVFFSGFRGIAEIQNRLQPQEALTTNQLHKREYSLLCHDKSW